MHVNRSDLLKVLESVSPGLSSKDLVEQSTCFAFKDGRVFTFNDEIACTRECELTFTGAVKSKPLLDILVKMEEEQVEVVVEQGTLIVKGARRDKASIRMEDSVELPIDDVEIPDDFTRLDKDFIEAIRNVVTCCSKEESEFNLTCVHLTEGYVEACDRYQAARYPIDLPFNECLVRGVSLARVLPFGVDEVCATDSWLHFRNQSGLTFSVRKYEEAYKDIGELFGDPGDADMVRMPKAATLEKVVDKARIFSSDNLLGNKVHVKLAQGKVLIVGEGAYGDYKGQREAQYDGPPLHFVIDPTRLMDISKLELDCYVLPDRMGVITATYHYVSRIEDPEDYKFEG